MKKSRMERLIPIANDALISQYKGVVVKYHNSNLPEREKEKIWNDAILRKKENNPFQIKSNYDGKVSGFGVAVALSGLRPALAMYFNESGDVKTRPVLEVIAKIIATDNVYKSLSQTTAKGLLEHALREETDLKKLKKYVLEASIALKQIVRTYELI